MNKTTKISLIVGSLSLVGGVIITLAIFWFSAPSLMMLEDESNYDFDTTIERFETALDEGGWSVLEIHDMQAVLDGHGHDVDAIKIYELCSSEYSAKILELDDERVVSPLMPCRVSIYEKSDGNTYISRMNSSLFARPFGGVINDVMQVAAEETEVIIDTLID